MEPKYSILLCNQSLKLYAEKISTWLMAGVKVLWFGSSDDVDLLKTQYPDFVKAFLLQGYVTTVTQSGLISDGVGGKHLLNELSTDCPAFNAAQYSVEHCSSSDNVIVQASAGTGKTTVMIDRILFLLHTQHNLHLPEIYMITFTNEAAQQMNNRLQDALMIRFRLTKQKKYLRWVEEQSQMTISTIHSFAFNMLKQLGINESFTKDLSIRSFEYEKQQLIKNAIDAAVDGKENVEQQLGVSFYRACSMVNSFWNKFAQLGISHQDMLHMDWGKPINEDSKNFDRILRKIIPELDSQYFDLKRSEESVAINDIMRDLQGILSKGRLPDTDLSMKYLFIDEFQDTDVSQIEVACLLGNVFGAVIFVVGDGKQSIYRFRGATERAFDMLRANLEKSALTKPLEFTLVNNYRTAAGVLNRLDDYFSNWAKQGYLLSERPCVPLNPKHGNIRMVHAVSTEDQPDQLTEIVKSALDDLIQRVEMSGKKPCEKDRVVVLTRSNKQLAQLGRVLQKAQIPKSIRREGAFYSSEAVRDFYLMVSSFVFCDEPKYIFNFLLTPYAGDIEPMNIRAMERLFADSENLTVYLDHFLSQTSWKKYHKMLRLKPVMSVFKEIFDNEPIVDTYISLNKKRRRDEGWQEARIYADTFTNARQYQANFEKLMEVLQTTFAGDRVSLYDIYNFLKLNIATNRSESEARAQSTDDYRSVLCMTVHKAKGLEFDTVIIPYTNQNFGGQPMTELLIDPMTNRVGWNYTSEKKKASGEPFHSEMKNSHYDTLKNDDIANNRLEGVRILYVGMTRAINSLICIVADSKNPMSWARLIEEVGVDYE